MTEQRHTPGPWRYEPSTVCEGDFVITGSNDHGGQVLPILGRTHNWPHNKEANARLIAAAPDLLDACDFALTILEGMGNGKGDAANACRAAIARATGGDQ